MEPTAGTRKRIIRSASAVSSGGGLRATAGQGSSLAPTRAGSDRALSRSDVHDILERLEALSKEEYNASPATSGVSSSRIRELEGKLRVAETEAERQAGKAAFYADEIKELRGEISL